ncbi:hypothetical protein Tco_1048431 [Tanacetum coccineum]
MDSKEAAKRRSVRRKRRNKGAIPCKIYAKKDAGQGLRFRGFTCYSKKTTGDMGLTLNRNQNKHPKSHEKNQQEATRKQNWKLQALGESRNSLKKLEYIMAIKIGDIQGSRTRN